MSTLTLRFNSDMIHSFIETTYCTLDELDETSNSITQKIFDISYYKEPFNSTTCFIFNNDLDNLIYLEYSCDLWTCYHQVKINSNLTEPMLFQRVSRHIEDLDTNYRYFSYFDSLSNKYYVLNKLGLNTNETSICFINTINFKSGICYYRSKISLENSLKIFKLNSALDIIIPTKTGLLHINPVSYPILLANMIRSKGWLSQQIDIVKTIFSPYYYDMFHPLIQKLVADFFKGINSLPDNCYANYHNYLKKNDNSFYSRLDIFNTEIIQLSNNVKKIIIDNDIIRLSTTIADFTHNLKHNFCKELNNLYHWFRNYPSIQKTVFRAHASHPYIILLNIIHNYYLANKRHISIEIIGNILSFDKGRNNISLLIIDAIRQRHTIFNIICEQNECTNYITPKYKNCQKKIPIDIFSVHLFIGNHILCNSD
jgi:hypothetical protein